LFHTWLRSFSIKTVAASLVSKSRSTATLFWSSVPRTSEQTGGPRLRGLRVEDFLESLVFPDQIANLQGEHRRPFPSGGAKLNVGPLKRRHSHIRSE
jgi:hypothetical protein